MKFLVLVSALFTLSCVQQPAATVKNTAINNEAACAVSAQAKALSDPQSIEELVQFINALPKPVELDCFVSALKRPLKINATSSVSSAQPANGTGSPRIFIMKGDLTIALVPSGIGVDRLEISESTSNTTSLKAEISLPVTETLDSADPYIPLLRVNRTSCIGCHVTENLVNNINGTPVFESEAFKPDPNRRISLNLIQQELYSCQTYKDQSDRCKILDELLSNGAVEWQDFPSTMPTMFGTF